MVQLMLNIPHFLLVVHNLSCFKGVYDLLLEYIISRFFSLMLFTFIGELAEVVVCLEIVSMPLSQSSHFQNQERRES